MFLTVEHVGHEEAGPPEAENVTKSLQPKFSGRIVGKLLGAPSPQELLILTTFIGHGETATSSGGMLCLTPHQEPDTNTATAYKACRQRDSLKI